MNLKNLQKNWNRLGERDPLWAILTWPDKKGRRWKEQDFFKTGENEIEEIIRYIESLGINISRKKALDFGCGVGRLTQALANHFDEVYGIDIAPSMIKLAKTYNKQADKCKYYLNNCNNLKIFQNNTFNFVCSFLTLQHMKPKYAKKYIKEFLRVLSPNGILIFQETGSPICNNKNRLIVFSKIILKKLLNIFKRPIFEMYGVKKENFIKFLKENNAKIIDIKKGMTPEWTSFKYFITKEK